MTTWSGQAVALNGSPVWGEATSSYGLRLAAEEG